MDGEQLELSHIANETVKWYHHLGKPLMDSMEVNMHKLYTHNFASSCLLREIKTYIHMLQRFHGSHIISSQNVERSQMPTVRRTDKGTPPSHSKEQAMAT